MVTEKESIIKFSEEFFKNIKAEFSWQGETLVVTKVSKDFETFSGKTSPYYLVFDSEKTAENTELLAKGSYFLRAMTNYLDNRGQTTLIKLDFPLDARQEINKFYKFNNCNITNVNQKQEYKYFLRFTFLTTFSFLNEKEQIMTPIFVDHTQIIDFNPSKYKTVEGKKQDVDLKDIKPSYALAREKLKEILQPKIQQVSQDLNKKLEKEIDRIKNHYSNHSNEGSEEVSKGLEHIKELEKEKQKTSEENKLSIDSRIKKHQENIHSLNNEKKKEELAKEEQFCINDEIHKHSLNIDNKLMNTSIIYYPIFNWTMTLSNSGGRGQTNLVYNPIEENISELNCEICRNELTQAYLCSLGHVTCRACLSVCRDCGKEHCKSCLSKSCGICGKQLCSKCAVKCSKCGKYRCKSHMGKSALTGNSCCAACLRSCSKCSKLIENNHLVNCPTCSQKFCPSCSKTSLIKIEGKTLCSNCSKHCSICNKVLPKNKFERCPSCKTPVCNFPGKCIYCRKQLCSKLRVKTKF